jgi:hypothetical protein
MRRCGTRVTCSHSVPSSKATIAFGEEFLYELKAGPAGPATTNGRRATGLTLAPPWCRSIEGSSTSFWPGRAKEATMPTATDRDFLDMPISDVRRVIRLGRD